jgi:Protein of unknown function (DUF3180)
VRRTSVPSLLALAVAGGVVAWLLQIALVAAGQATLVPPGTLVLVLFGIAAVLLALGWPIRQFVRGKRKRRIDPFRAMRTLLFAQASSLMGSLLAGAAIGAVLYLFSRPVPAGGASAWLTGGALVGAVAVAVSGLVVEQWCRLPPQDPERDDEQEARDT